MRANGERSGSRSGIRSRLPSESLKWARARSLARQILAHGLSRPKSLRNACPDRRPVQIIAGDEKSGEVAEFVANCRDFLHVTEVVLRQRMLMPPNVLHDRRSFYLQDSCDFLVHVISDLYIVHVQNVRVGGSA